MVTPAPPRPLRLSYENVARILYHRLDLTFADAQRTFLRDLLRLQSAEAGQAVLGRLVAAGGGGLTMPAPGSPEWNALTADLRALAAAQQVVFNAQAQAVIRSAAEAAAQAVPQVAALAAGGGASALRAAWNQVDPLAVISAMIRMHQPAFEQAVRNYGSQFVNAAQQILVAGIASGQNPRTTARLLRQMITTMPAHAATRMTRTLQMNAYRSATAMHQRANARVLGKQIRICALDDRTCLACLALHGKEYPIGEEIVDHASGRCIGIAIPRGSEVTVQSGQDWFDGLPEVRQRQIMGPANWRAWQAGAVRLDQFVGYRTDPVWGRQTVQRSLSGILGPAANAWYTRPRRGGGGGSGPAPARTPILRTRAQQAGLLPQSRWEAVRRAGRAIASGVNALVSFTNGEYHQMRLAQRFTWEELGRMGKQHEFSSRRAYTTYRNKSTRAEAVLQDPSLPTFDGRIQRKLSPPNTLHMSDVELAQYLQSTPDVLQIGAPVRVGQAFSEGVISSYSHQPDVWTGNVVLHIRQNRTGVSVETISRHSSEREIVMPASAVFRVESITPASQLPPSHPMAGHVHGRGAVIIELTEFEYVEDLTASLASRQTTGAFIQ
jgi:hypothetical protein